MVRYKLVLIISKNNVKLIQQALWLVINAMKQESESGGGSAKSPQQRLLTRACKAPHPNRIIVSCNNHRLNSDVYISCSDPFFFLYPWSKSRYSKVRLRSSSCSCLPRCFMQIFVLDSFTDNPLFSHFKIISFSVMKNFSRVWLKGAQWIFSEASPN